MGIMMATSKFASFIWKLLLLLVIVLLLEIDMNRLVHGSPISSYWPSSSSAIARHSVDHSNKQHYAGQFNDDAETIDPFFEPSWTDFLLTTSTTTQSTASDDPNASTSPSVTTREPFLVISKMFKLNLFNLLKIGKFLGLRV